MSSAFEFEIGNRVAGHCSALQLMLLSLYENILSLLLPLLLCALSSADGAVLPADIKKPRRPSGRECTLFSATFRVIQQHTGIHQRAMHAGCKHH